MLSGDFKLNPGPQLSDTTPSSAPTTPGTPMIPSRVIQIAHANWPTAVFYPPVGLVGLPPFRWWRPDPSGPAFSDRAAAKPGVPCSVRLALADTFLDVDTTAMGIQCPQGTNATPTRPESSYHQVLP